MKVVHRLTGSCECLVKLSVIPFAVVTLTTPCSHSTAGLVREGANRALIVFLRARLR